MPQDPAGESNKVTNEESNFHDKGGSNFALFPESPLGDFLCPGRFLILNPQSPVPGQKTPPPALLALQILTFLRASTECFLAGFAIPLPLAWSLCRQIPPNEGQSQSAHWSENWKNRLDLRVNVLGRYYYLLLLYQRLSSKFFFCSN